MHLRLHSSSSCVSYNTSMECCRLFCHCRTAHPSGFRVGVSRQQRDRGEEQLSANGRHRSFPKWGTPRLHQPTPPSPDFCRISSGTLNGSFTSSLSLLSFHPLCRKHRVGVIGVHILRPRLPNPTFRTPLLLEPAAVANLASFPRSPAIAPQLKNSSYKRP